ncbi:MAG: YfiR family protein [Bacteroidota bacterium]|nr:YfiR family protein [Bacteroidota bacterium]
MKKKISQSLIVISALMLVSVIVFAQEINYKIHSMFIYHFTRYIDWPESKKTGNFVIGIYGNSQIQSELEAMAATKKAGTQTMNVRKISSVDEALECHIVFVCANKSSELDAITAATANKPILLVTEKNGLAKKGAGINFIISDDKLKFEINKSSVESHSLKVSGDLVKLGIVI